MVTTVIHGSQVGAIPLMAEPIDAPKQSIFLERLRSTRIKANDINGDLRYMESQAKQLHHLESEFKQMPDSLAGLREDLQDVFDRHREANGWPAWDVLGY
jgi:hypothetical protein